MTAYALEQKRKRGEEGEQKAAVAAAFNASQRAADVVYDARIAAALAAQRAADSASAERAADALEQADLTEAERWADYGDYLERLLVT